ncbi:Hypothetical predicted protein [Xyrichtys novacula]|uniref:Uncharacterized protein n=1 Tax=Xyrichtys novacula TaxID=13765 RepID=A0AAV1FUT0_XYRNO|nr:Hypothetical predicted protein [Xyrichtys novacula]
MTQKRVFESTRAHTRPPPVMHKKRGGGSRSTHPQLFLLVKMYGGALDPQERRKRKKTNKVEVLTRIYKKDRRAESRTLFVAKSEEGGNSSVNQLRGEKKRSPVLAGLCGYSRRRSRPRDLDLEKKERTAAE